MTKNSKYLLHIPGKISVGFKKGAKDSDIEKALKGLTIDLLEEALDAESGKYGIVKVKPGQEESVIKRLRKEYDSILEYAVLVPARRPC